MLERLKEATWTKPAFNLMRHGLLMYFMFLVIAPENEPHLQMSTE